MCGIFGVFSHELNKKFNRDLVSTSLDTMKHRGPDASDFKIFDERVCLGHLRLAIIDLNPESNQPYNIENRYWIVYNGEIYNYLELRDELQKTFSVVFKTESDTEVLLRAYQYWGEECVHRFNGMWAFAIYDIFENKLFCSRDRFGVKPFNYAEVEGQFIFASEIKAILNYFPQLKIPNYNVIANFCRSSIGAQHKETWFEGINRLQPAHNLVITSEGIKIYRYWEYPTKTNKELSFEDAKNEYFYLFKDAVKLRLRSDVPIGTTLSSGIDSNSIIYSMRDFYNGQLHTFTAAFDSGGFDDLDKISYNRKSLIIDEAAIVKQTTRDLSLESHIIETNYDNFIFDLKKIIFHLESGNSSPAVFPLMQVMEKAKDDVTVILEGQGADEMLAGYQQSLFIASVIECIKRFRFVEAYKIIKKSIKVYSFLYSFKLYVRQLSNRFPVFAKFYQWHSGVEEVYTSQLVVKTKMKDYPDSEEPKFDSLINKMLYRQHKGGLVNLLHYGDAISMAHSLESRLPFMDYRLVEFAFRLPWEYKLHGEYGKYIHRQAMKGIVPDTILDETIKFGFNTPISQFFKLKNTLPIKPKDILLSERSLERGLFNRKGLNNLFEEHEKGLKNNSTLLYRLLCVELWFQEFIDN